MFRLYVLFYFFVCSFCGDVFVLKKGKNYYCVTNSSSALSWIDNDEENRVSTFIPRSPPNNFDLDEVFRRNLEHFAKSSWLWKISSSEIILDRRWENMPIYVIDKEETSKYIKIASYDNGNFAIALSVRLHAKAHILLCDENDPEDSNCYWFILPIGNKDRKSEVRLCNVGDVENLTYTSYSLNASADEILKINRWSHFKMIKDNNTISFSFTKKGKEQTFLKWTDSNATFSVRNVFVCARKVTEFWKIHEVDFLHTTHETNNTELEPAISVQNGFVCISVFLSMCDSCRLKLALGGRDGDIYKEKTFTSTTSIWTEIKFMVEGIPVDEVYLSIWTLGGDENARFWAIGKIRLCQEKEFRVLASQTQDSCQLISDHDEEVFSGNWTYGSLNQCPEGSVGSFCIPCHWVTDNCDKIRICAQRKDGQTSCWCSLGYDIISDCVNECADNFFGFGCKNICGQCFNEFCDKKVGTCSKCKKTFVGPKCDRKTMQSSSNLQLNWDLKNDMVLEWEQTDAKQCLLKKFTVVVSSIPPENRSTFITEYAVVDNNYEKNFIHKVESVNLPKSQQYSVRIVASNLYSQNETRAQTPSPWNMTRTMSTPTIHCVNASMLVEFDAHQNVTLFLLVSARNRTTTNSKLENIQEVVDLSQFTIVDEAENLNGHYNFRVGDGTNNSHLKSVNFSAPYNITLVLLRNIDNKTVINLYFYNSSICALKNNTNDLYYLFFLLLLAIIMIVLYILFRNVLKKRKKMGVSNYENGEIIKARVGYTSRKYQDWKRFTKSGIFSMQVPIKHFNKYLQEANKHNLLLNQFGMLPRGKRLYEEIDIYPFDFLDMTYCDSFRIKEAYVVCEVPKSKHFAAFWKRVWAENIKLIVLLSGSAKQGSRYWPELNEIFYLGNMALQLHAENASDRLAIRKFLLTTSTTEMKFVDHIHLSYDRNNDRDYVFLLKKLQIYSLSTTSPILVHSSDNLRQAGFVLLCDMSLRMAERDDAVDIWKTSWHLGSCNPDYVDDFNSYKFAHSIVSYMLRA